MLTRPIALALTIAASLAFAVPGTAGQAGGAPQELTALDYFQIQQLVAKYARFIDTCSNNGYDYADLYTPDGAFRAERNGKVSAGSVGREKLAEVSGGGSRACKNVGWIKQGVRHLYVNHIITPTADGATGTVDMLMIGLGGDPNKIEHDGYYEDTYVKTAQGWRFKERIHHVRLTGTPAAAPGQPAAPIAPAAPAAGTGAPASGTPR
jgi:hypothetical protein